MGAVDQADLIENNQTIVEKFTSDVAEERLKGAVAMNLFADKSAEFEQGVSSIFVFDNTAPSGIEDTKTDGTEQSDLRGTSVASKLELDKYKTIGGYFYFVADENVVASVGWLASFLKQAPKKAVEHIETALLTLAVSKGAVSGHYLRLGETSLNAVPNSVISLANLEKVIEIMCQGKNIAKSDLFCIMSQVHSAAVPKIFGAYDAVASGPLAEAAKKNGFIQGAMGIPFYASNIINTKAIVATSESIMWAWRTAKLDYDHQPSFSRDYYGFRVSYGIKEREGQLDILVLGREENYTAGL